MQANRQAEADGPCVLCPEVGDLRRSHLIPAAFYARVHEGDSEHRPLVLTSPRRGAVIRDFHWKGHLLVTVA